MRKFAAFILMLSLGMFVVGCGGGSEEEGTGEDATTETTGETGGASDTDSTPVSRENRAEDGSDEK